MEYEEEKVAQGKRLKELSALNTDLQNQLNSSRHELMVANTELRILSTYNSQNNSNNNNNKDQQAAAGPMPQAVIAAQPASASAHMSSQKPIDDSILSYSEEGNRAIDPIGNSPHHHQPSAFGTTYSSEQELLSSAALHAADRKKLQNSEVYAKDLHRQ